MTKDEWYKQLFEHLEASKFRSSFHLKQKDIDYINEKGLDVIMQHAPTKAERRPSCIYCTACYCNMLSGVNQKVA